MKKNILTSLLLLLSIATSAQNKKQTITITTKLGKVYTYVMGETIDSTRVIEGVGIKIYPKNETVSKDFLFSQIEYTITEDSTPTPTPDPTNKNANRNTEDDLKRNPEGWRLEFPHFYQGTNKTYEVTHYTTEGARGRLVNYSLEWDVNLKANRWSCYQMYDILLQKMPHDIISLNQIQTSLRTNRLLSKTIQEVVLLVDTFAHQMTDVTQPNRMSKHSI